MTEDIRYETLPDGTLTISFKLQPEQIVLSADFSLTTYGKTDDSAPSFTEYFIDSYDDGLTEGG
jgi:hypothetical protein